MIFYSKQAKGFFDSSINTTIPSDAVAIAAEKYQEMMAAQAAGKVITADSAGKPVASDPPPPTQAEQNEMTKAALAEIDSSSVRALREWLASQPSAPQWIKDHEIAAQTERAKLP